MMIKKHLTSMTCPRIQMTLMPILKTSMPHLQSSLLAFLMLLVLLLRSLISLVDVTLTTLTGIHALPMKRLWTIPISGRKPNRG
jgi:hypothetical protein